MSNKLEESRLIINKIDQEMAKLFEERMKATSTIAEYKLKHGLPIYDKVREQELINKNINYIQDETLKEYYINFLKNTMDLSKKYQSRLTEGLAVAYSGVEGAFAHIASQKMFPNANYKSYKNFNEAYIAVENGDVDICVLPLENSYAGEVGTVMDLMFSGSLYINQVIELEVVHNLVAIPNTKLENIKTIVSHPQALSQCSDFLKEYDFEIIEATNTAVAAKMVSEKNDSSIAAIASIDTADLYGLEIVEKRINSKHNNTTRFGAFSRTMNSTKSNENMASCFALMFTVKNEAGALAKTLNIIGSYGFNMRCLRSRLMKELIWNYYFFVELEGSSSSQDGIDMLKALQVFCDELKVVGTYKLN